MQLVPQPLEVWLRLSIADMHKHTLRSSATHPSLTSLEGHQIVHHVLNLTVSIVSCQHTNATSSESATNTTAYANVLSGLVDLTVCHLSVDHQLTDPSVSPRESLVRTSLASVRMAGTVSTAMSVRQTPLAPIFFLAASVSARTALATMAVLQSSKAFKSAM